mmetsp:Transcript_1604/g.4436  ORF Transcript_1604/g.4436 Transcript_1604/m.4436 type:complete len:208 (-) Transcript_1604:54-677(-)
MTCLPSASCAWRSKTLVGDASPSSDQWYTAVGVTMAMVLLFTQRQNLTASVMACAFILVRSSRLKIWSCDCERRAMTLATGFMMAASAEMGRRVTSLLFERSIMVTFPPPQTEMNLSDSIAQDPNLIESAGTCMAGRLMASWKDTGIIWAAMMDPRSVRPRRPLASAPLSRELAPRASFATLRPLAPPRGDASGCGAVVCGWPWLLR